MKHAECPRCVLSWMLPHPEFLFWIKCTLCGYSRPTEEANHHPKDKLYTRRLNSDITNLVRNETYKAPVDK